MNPISQLVTQILIRSAEQATFLAAIDGPGGAGKSTLAGALAAGLRSAGHPVEIVHFDDFYLPSHLQPKGMGAERPIGSDFDWERLRDQVLSPLSQGLTTSYERYDWPSDALAETITVSPGQIVIVEGVYSSRNEIAAFYNYRIWVKCPQNIRLSRGIARDGEAIRDRWERDWIPAENRYVKEHRPDLTADVVVSGVTAE